MSFFRRSLLLFAACSSLCLWAFGLEGAAAWGCRVALVLAFSALAAHMILRPWREMASAARRVREEDFSARLDDVTPGDLREPSAAFNAMAGHLAELRALSQEREGRFNAVLEAGGRAVLLMGREGEILLTSPATQKLFPRFREDAMLTSLGLPGLTQQVEESLESRETQTATFTEAEGGRGRVFDARIVPLQNGGVVVILDEMTAQARLDRVKADLVANVSHELRTPLAAMSSLLEALESPELAPGQRCDFESRLRVQLDRMMALVEDLLSLSRLEGQRVEVRKEPVPLGWMVGELFATLSHQASAAGVALVSEIPEALLVSADRSLLEMALRNLVDNAIRYNCPGGTVTVRASSERGGVRIEVRDTGEGIPAPHLDRIFERFYRVEPHRSREKGGTGLGLAIVKHATSQLGGTVAVESTPGKGSAFWLEFPSAG